MPSYCFFDSASALQAAAIAASAKVVRVFLKRGKVIIETSSDLTSGEREAVGSALEKVVRQLIDEPAIPGDPIVETALPLPSGADQAGLTDSTGGSVDGTLADVTGLGTVSVAAVNSNFSDLTSRINALRQALVDKGIIKGSA